MIVGETGMRIASKSLPLGAKRRAVMLRKGRRVEGRRTLTMMLRLRFDCSGAPERLALDAFCLIWRL